MSLIATFVWLGIPFFPSHAQTSEKNSIIVKFKKASLASLNMQLVNGIVQTGVGSLDTLGQKYKLQKLARIFWRSGKFADRHAQHGLPQFYQLTFPARTNAAAAAQSYRADPNIEMAQINRRYALYAEQSRSNKLQLTPNDSLFSKQWNLHNIGQSGGQFDEDLDMPEAWNITIGDSSVVIANLDTGQDLDHPDLAANLWINRGEIPNNKIDDDNNGYIDDITGWNFSNNDNNPDDTDGHGTQTAGIVAAMMNNKIGIAGIAPNSKIMVCKIFPNATDETAAEAFVYAADNGAKLSMNGWGHDSPNAASPLVEAAINYFIAASGGGVVFAAGNYNTSDATWGYPASLPFVTAVAAVDHNDFKAAFSNWGSWIDLAAPGVNITTTTRGGGYTIVSGTSMACPHVAGVAALTISAHPDWPMGQINSYMHAGVDNIYDVNPFLLGQLGTGRVNAYKALGGPIPEAPDSLRAVVADQTVYLKWKNPTQNNDGTPITPSFINLYRNENLIAKLKGDMAQYVDTVPRYGTFKYMVAAVGADGKQGFISKILTVQVSLSATPEIVASPLSFQETVAPKDTLRRGLMIKNAGAGALTFSLQDTIPWLQKSTASGVVAPGKTALIDLAFDAKNLAPGKYNAVLVIHSNDADEPKTLVTIALTVNAETVGIVTQSGYPKSNQSKVFYHDSQWWTLAFNSSAGAWQLWRHNGAFWRPAPAPMLEKGRYYRLDAFVNTAANKLYVISSHHQVSNFRRFSYVGSAWTLDTGFPVALANFVNVNQANPISLVQAKNGDLWLFRIEANKLQALRSKTGGATWSTPINVKTNLHTANGVTDAAAFSMAGNDYVGVGYAETEASTLNSQYGFLLHHDGQSDSAWVDESAALTFWGNERANNNLCMAVAPGNDVYFFTQNSRYQTGDPRNTLYKRANAGGWQKYKVNTGVDGLNWKTPALAIDASNNRLYCFGVNIGNGRAQYKAVTLGEESKLETTPANEIFTAPDNSFADLSVPAANVTATSGLMMTIDNTAADDIWYRHFTMSGAATPIVLDTITIASNQINAKTRYAIPITLGGNGSLNAGVGTIHLRFPDNTLIPSNMSASQVLVNGVPAKQVVTYSATRQVTVTTPINLPNNAAFKIVFTTATSLVNPSLPGVYQLKVWTSSQLEEVNSPPYNFVTTTTRITPATVTPATPNPGKGMAYLITFNVGPRGRLIPGSSKIFLQFPANTGVNDTHLNGTKINSVEITSYGDPVKRQVIVPVPAAATINNNDSVKIFLPQPFITNPTAPGSYTALAWTSVETTMVASQPYHNYSAAGAPVPETIGKFDRGNQSKTFFHAGKWWMVAQAKPDGKWYLWRYDYYNWTTSSFWTRTTLVSSAPRSRPDCIVSWEENRVYILLPGASTTLFTRLTYAAGSWSVDPGYPYAIPDFAQTDDRGLGFVRARNGWFWIFMIKDATLLAKRSSTNGRTWSATITLKRGLNSATGLVDAVAFDGIGEKLVGVGYAETSGPNAVFGFLRHADPASDTSWVDETASVPQFPGTTANDHIAMRDYGQGVHLVVQTSGGTPGAVNVGLLVRTRTGAWGKYPVTLSNTWVRPILAIDGSNNVLYVIGARTGPIRLIELKRAPVGSYHLLLHTKIDTLLRSNADSFINPMVAQHGYNPEMNLMVCAANATRDEIWSASHLLRSLSFKGDAPEEQVVAADTSDDDLAGAQLYPNPFNAQTVIRFKLKKNSAVQLRLFNLNGQVVRTLIDANLPAGVHQRHWNGRDQAGHAVASGIYFYRLQIDGRIFKGKMQMLK